MALGMAVAKQPILPEPTYYTWSFPGCPVVIHLDLAAAGRLRKLLTEESASRQGLLLGAVDGRTTQILDFDPLPSSRIPDVQASVHGHNERRAGNKPVGYFRVTAEPDLKLSAADLALAQACFAHPQDIFLLAHVTESGPPQATFFFWDSRGMSGDFAFLEFSLDTEALASQERQRVIRRNAEKQNRQSPAIEPQAAPSAAPSTLKGPRQLWPVLKFVGAAFLVAAIAFWSRVLYDSYSRNRAASSSEVSAVAAPVAPLPAIGLRAQRQNSDLMITWDRDTAPVARATSGKVQIHDGSSVREIPLNATQVQSGSVLYLPQSDQVEIQLTVSSPSSSVSESVLVILPKSGPPQVRPVRQAAAPVTNAAAVTEGSRPLKTFTAPAAAQVKPNMPVLDEAPRLPAGSRPLTAAPLVGTLPPPLVQRPQAPPASQAPASQAPPSAALPPAVSSTQPPAASGYFPPEAITKIPPQFPEALLPVALKAKTVQVRVRIDEKGKVIKADVIPQKDIHGLLTQEALRAARGWRFRPARQGNQPVVGEMILSFTFNNPRAAQ